MKNSCKRKEESVDRKLSIFKSSLRKRGEERTGKRMI
jgi:hypothetical protein